MRLKIILFRNRKEQQTRICNWLGLSVFIGLLSSLVCGFEVSAAEKSANHKLVIGYASVTGSRISLWAAHDLGFFRRQDLESELIFIGTSSRGIPALIAGEIPVFSGSPETAAQAAARGAELVMIASDEPTAYKLIVQPGIKTVEQLKGKKVGIDRIGGTSYYATRRLLERLGLQARDVEFMQIPGGGSDRVAAFRSGILSAMVTTIGRVEEAKVSYHVLADALEMGVQFVGGAFLTTQSYRNRNRDLLQKFIRGLIEASYWVKTRKNRDGVLQIFSRHLRSGDPSFLQLNYRLYIDALPFFPYTNIETLRQNLADLAENNPKLRELNLNDFVDNSFIQRVQQEGVGQPR